MSNVAITSLPPATVPLTGNEVIPIVQGASTKQVAVSDFPTNVANATGVLSVSHGGTGAGTVTGAASALLPDQTGHADEVLSTDGAGTLSWVTNGSGSGLPCGWGSISGGFLQDGAQGINSVINSVTGEYALNLTEDIGYNTLAAVVCTVNQAGGIAKVIRVSGPSNYPDLLVEITDTNGTSVDGDFSIFFIGFNQS